MGSEKPQEEFLNGPVRIHYLVDGPETTDTLPLILMHGLTANAQYFRGLLRHGMAESRRIFRVDLCGRGQSGKPEHGYTMQDHAEDILRLMDDRGLAEAILVGHSFGGLLTLYLTANYPDRVKAQVVIDIAGPSIHNAQVLELIRPSLDRLDQPVASLEAFFDRVKALPSLDGYWDEDVQQYFHADVAIRPDGTVIPQAPKAAIFEAIAKGQAEDWGALIRAATAPALVLHASGPFGPAGTPPIVTDAQAQDLMEHLPNGRYVKVPGNHMTMLFGDAGRKVVVAIQDFLATPSVG